MISKQRRAWSPTSSGHDPSDQTGPVPDRRTRFPTRTARLKPIVGSYGDPEEISVRSVTPRRQYSIGLSGQPAGLLRLRRRRKTTKRAPAATATSSPRSLVMRTRLPCVPLPHSLVAHSVASAPHTQRRDGVGGRVECLHGMHRDAREDGVQYIQPGSAMPAIPDTRNRVSLVVREAITE